jgi:hypothetical protein
VPGKAFQPSLMFVGRDEAYLTTVPNNLTVKMRLDREQLIMTLSHLPYFNITNCGATKVSVFVPGKVFLPSLMFVDKAEAYLSTVPNNLPPKN